MDDLIRANALLTSDDETSGEDLTEPETEDDSGKIFEDGDDETGYSVWEN